MCAAVMPQQLPQSDHNRRGSTASSSSSEGSSENAQGHGGANIHSSNMAEMAAPGMYMENPGMLNVPGSAHQQQQQQDAGSSKGERGASANQQVLNGTARFGSEYTSMAGPQQQQQQHSVVQQFGGGLQQQQQQQFGSSNAQHQYASSTQQYSTSAHYSSSNGGVTYPSNSAGGNVTQHQQYYQPSYGTSGSFGTGELNYRGTGSIPQYVQQSQFMTATVPSVPSYVNRGAYTTTSQVSSTGGGSSVVSVRQHQQHLNPHPQGQLVGTRSSGTILTRTLSGGDVLQFQGGERYITGGGTSRVVSSTGETSFITGSRIVTGEERVVGMTTRVDESRSTILSERIVEHEIKVPKKIIREEMIEKIIVVPERVIREEVVEDIQKIKETIIEVAKPVIHERTVEVPEIMYVDKVVEYAEKVFQEKIKEVPKIEYQDRVTEIPVIVTQERLVEVPELVYRDVVSEKVVEVPEIREQVVMREVAVDQYVEKPVAEHITVEIPYDVERNIPVPVEAVTTFEYRLPRFNARVNQVHYPLYVPQFIEVPVAQELFDAHLLAEVQSQNARLGALNSSQAIGLCDIETLATDVKRLDIAGVAGTLDFHSALMGAWKSGRLGIASHGHVQTGSSVIRTFEGSSVIQTGGITTSRQIYPMNTLVGSGPGTVGTTSQIMTVFPNTVTAQRGDSRVQSKKGRKLKGSAKRSRHSRK